MDKEDVVHICSGVLLGHKKGWNNDICSNIDGPRDHHTKWSQKDTYHLYAEPKIWNEWTYLQNRNRLTDIKNRFVLAKGSERWIESLGLPDANYYRENG